MKEGRRRKEYAASTVSWLPFLLILGAPIYLAAFIVWKAISRAQGRQRLHAEVQRNRQQIHFG
jgi:hypothetical protein